MMNILYSNSSERYEPGRDYYKCYKNMYKKLRRQIMIRENEKTVASMMHARMIMEEREREREKEKIVLESLYIF